MTSRELGAPTSVATSRHRREDSSTLALSTDVTLAAPAARPGWNASAHDAPDLVVGVLDRVDRARRRRPRSSRAVGCPKYSPPVSSRTTSTSTPASRSALSGDAAASAGMRRAPGAGWRRGRAPCRSAEQALLGPHLGACGSSHFGPPTAPSSTASARLAGGRASRRAARCRGVDGARRRSAARRTSSVWPCARATASSTRAPSPTTSGPMPSPARTTMRAFFFRIGYRAAVAVMMPTAWRRRRCQAVFDAVGERLPDGFDHVRRTRRPCVQRSRAVASIDQHARHGAGAGAAVQNADLVVGELDRATSGYDGPSALRSAASSAFTGPLPSAAVWTRCRPPTSILTVGFRERARRRRRADQSP